MRHRDRSLSKNSSATAALLLTCVLLFMGNAANAAAHVLSPIVDQGELEIEIKADRTNDTNSDLNNAQSSNISIGYGVTDYWATELETQWKKDPNGSRFYDSTSWENRFQLTPQGKYWLDAGIFAEYEHVVQDGDHDSVTLGLLLQKEFGRNVTTFNFLLTSQLGSEAPTGTQVEYRMQTRWRLNPMFEPGLELYGEPGELGQFNTASEQRTRMGPVMVGVLPVGGPGKLKYELGYLRGLNSVSEQNTVRLLLEYEMHF